MPSDTAGNTSRGVAPSRRPKALLFYVGLPMILAIVSATQPGYTNVFGLGGALLYLSLISLVPWWIAEGATWLVWWAARRVRPPLWLLCGLGILIGFLVAYPFVMLVTDFFVQLWPGAAESDVLVSSSTGVFGTMIQSFHGMAYWILANYLFDRFLQFPRFRYQGGLENASGNLGGNHHTSATTLPKLLQQAEKFHCLADITLIKAKEHYVRLYGSDREELVPYRFGLALPDMMAEDGFRVHRSYWVRRTAVDHVEERSGRVELILHGGQKAPVSRQYHGLVRQIFPEPFNK